MTEKAVIELTAIDRASAVMATVKGKADELSKSADQVKAAWSAGVFDSFTKGPALAVVGVLGAASAAAIGLGTYFVSLAKQTMEAQAALKSMSEVTGASVEGLSAIRGVAKLAGTDMEAVAGGMTKLAKNVSTGGDEIEKGLKAIGLSLKDLQGLKTDEQFTKVAQAMGHYADGAGKTAAAQIILGKSGAQLLPLMKDLAEAGDLVAKVTMNQAKEADDLEKNIKRLTMAKEAWKKVVGAELVPVLDDVVRVMLTLQTQSNGTLDVTKKLAADGSIRTWAQDAALGVAYVVDTAKTAAQVFKVMGLAAIAVGADVMAGITTAASAAQGFGGVLGELATKARAAAQTARNEFNGAFDKLLTGNNSSTVEALEKQFRLSGIAAKYAGDQYLDARDRMAQFRPQVTGLTADTKALAAATNDSYARMMTAIAERLTAENTLAAGVEKVSETEKYVLHTTNELTLSSNKFTASQIEGVKSALALLSATAKQNKEAEEHKKLLEQMLKLQSEQLAIEVQVIGAAADRTRAMADENEKLREQITTFGMTEQQVNDLNIARLQSKLVTYEAAKATGYLTEQDAKAAEEIAAQIGLLRERNGLLGSKEVLERAKKMQDDLKSVWQGIGNDISNWIMSGFKNTRDLLKRMFETLVLRPVISPIGNSIAGGLQGLFGGSGGGAFGGMFNGITSAFNSFWGSGTTDDGVGGIIPGSGVAGLLEKIPGVGEFLSKIPGLGVITGVVSLISQLIGSLDEKGFKFDNSLRNVAAAPANVQQAMLGNFAPSGDVDGKLLGAIQPFITKVQALDKYIGTNLLSDDTLAQVRERIQALQNPRWWNLEDKDAIEKASKYFLQQRYGAAFESINEQVATTIKTFQGSADELLAYIDSFITMRETVLAAQRAAQDAISGTSEALQGMLDQQSNSVLAAYRAQQRGVGDLLNIAPDAENALAQLVTGMSSFRSAALQMMLQIKQVQDAIGGMFGDTIRSLQLSVMTPEQQYAFLQNEADQLLRQALQSNDPLQIQQLMQRLNADVNQAMSLLSPEQRAAVVPEQIARLTDINNQLQNRLSDLSNNVQNNLQATLQNLSDRLDKIAQANLDAAAKQNAAADKNLVAAATPNQLVLTVDLVNNTAVIGPPKEVGG